MKKIALLLLGVLAFNSCKHSKINPFSEEVEMLKGDQHRRIEGTKLFAVIPKEYKFIEQLGRYQKDEKQFIQFIESSVSFLERRKNFTKEALGPGTVIFEEIKFNKYDGIFAEGENPNNNESDLILLFGDENYLAMIVGKTESDQPENRKELIDIIKTIVYDKTFSLDELELANFTFDKSITGYKHAMTATNMFLYSENGKEDEQNPMANSMAFSNLPKMNEKKLKSYMENMVKTHQTNGVSIDNDEIKELKIGEYKALILDSKTKFRGRRGCVYHAVLSDEKQSMIFIGSGYEKIVELREKFIKTVETIRMN